MDELVRYERDGKIVTLTLDDGKVNALSPRLIAAVMAGLDRAEAEEGVRALVLAGRPGRFCAGFDLRVLTKGREGAEPMVRAGSDMFMRLYGFPRPVVAACTGHALAGGALLLLCCDARIGTQGEFKLGLNEVAIGIELPVLVRRLADDRLANEHKVEATLLANVYDPAGARSVGFLDEVVPAESTLARANERARELARLTPSAFRRSKAMVRAASIEHIRGALDEDLERIMMTGPR